MSIHPNMSPHPQKPEIDDPEEYLEMLLKSKPRMKKRDIHRKVVERFPWWNCWKPWWRADDSSSSRPEEKTTRGPWSRTNTAPGADQQRRDDIKYQQRRERVERDRARRKQQEANSGPNMESERHDGVFAEGDRAVLEWTLTSTDYSQFRIEDHHTDADAVQILLSAMAAIRQERDSAIDIIHLLMRERNEARASMASQSRAAQQNRENQSNPLYRKVGLDEKCPDFVLDAVRRAYRVRFHPDKYPSAHRVEAERRFKEAEAVFEQIVRLRGTPP
jgi:hypothetical protein